MNPKLALARVATTRELAVTYREDLGDPVTAAQLERTADAEEADTLQAACRERVKYKNGKNGEHKITHDIVNAQTILRYDPRWQGAGRIYYDDLESRTRCASPPWHPDDAPSSACEDWSDDDDRRLDLWFRRYWGLELPLDVIRGAVNVTAQRNSVNALQVYMNGLRWDGTKRLDTWLARYLGCEESEYTRIVGAKWMISGAARAMRPGCKVDYALILEGPQGRGKSTALATLCPAPCYFTDSPVDFASKDGPQALRGKFIVELAELASMKKADIDRVKSFFTTATDKYRPPYGRREGRFHRSCIFAGTTNSSEYLKDETGNRRFWPIKVGIIDLEGLACDREQLWAEAVHRYRAGESWWPQFEHTAMLETEQASRVAVDPWAERVAAWLERQPVDADHKCKLVTIADVLTGAVGLALAAQGQREANRVTPILRSLGWERRLMRVGPELDARGHKKAKQRYAKAP